MKNSNWIWENAERNKDEYVKFYDTFVFSGKKTGIKISCDGNYELYLNGVFIASGQYSDYPYSKVYDELDLTPNCKTGVNTLVILVWHMGVGTSCYIDGVPGLIYEVGADDEILAYSSERTLCKKTDDYVCGHVKWITGQLGLSYKYDSRKYDGYDRENFSPDGMKQAVISPKNPEELIIRPNKKYSLLSFQNAVLCDKEKHIYDMGKEIVGHLSFRIKAEAGAEILISYGEHLIDGEVRRRIGSRDFSVEFTANGEFFEFSNHMRRLGCRYLQVSCDKPFEVGYIGLYPAEYPLCEIPFDAGNQLRQKIYDTCVRTLRLCMFEHYEDCPWREQSLYTLDSRNQMLCGYYAFGEYEFPRSCLTLIGKGRRDDNLLHICAPSQTDLCIPFFSVIYIIQSEEYVRFSGDTGYAYEFWSKFESILDVFLSRRKENGVIPSFSGDRRYWNFYEWAPTLSGKLGSGDNESYDIVLNASVSIALSSMAKMSSVLGKIEDEKRYLALRDDLNRAINEVFYSEEKKLYRTSAGKEWYSELGNALSVLCLAAGKEKRKHICDAIKNNRGELVKTTLSMTGFKYDAMIMTDPDEYKEYILSEIDRDYGHMLDEGATSFWETIEGAAAFDNAGSLCHGWSAVPIIYYHYYFNKNLSR